MQQLLQRSPDTSQISSYKNNQGGDRPYLPIDELWANTRRVFGLRLSAEIVDFPQVRQSKTPRADGRVMISCKVRVLLINGSVREGIGYESFHPLTDSMKDIAYRFQSCISYAFKNVLKQFGPYLGLGLVKPTGAEPTQPQFGTAYPQVVTHDDPVVEQMERKLMQLPTKKQISVLYQNKKGDDIEYMKATEVFANANEVFGFDLNHTVVKEPQVVFMKPNTGEVLYGCISRYSVNNCWAYAEGAGFKFIHVSRSIEQVEDAHKICLTDSNKHALKIFGPYLGMVFPDEQQQLVVLPTPPPQQQQQEDVQAMCDAFIQSGN